MRVRGSETGSERWPVIGVKRLFKAASYGGGTIQDRPGNCVLVLPAAIFETRRDSADSSRLRLAIRVFENASFERPRSFA